MESQELSEKSSFYDKQLIRLRGALPSVYFFTALCSFIYLMPPKLVSQPKHDNIWVLGHGGEGIVFDFSDGALYLSGINTDMYHYGANISMCDPMGNLLYYSNAVSVSNANNETMINGDGIDLGLLTGSTSGGVNVPQIILSLPKPEDTGRFYIFYKSLNYNEAQMIYYSIFQYLLIDMSINNGLGGVVEKNKTIFEGVYLDWGEITACKHANGRDWWILLGEADSNNYYRFLVTPEGIINHKPQLIGGTVYNGAGQAVFSPSGTKFARLNQIDLATGNFIDIYDFDRCEGLLSNHVQLNYIDSAWAGGIAFSPNSRFLYVSSHYHIYQYDMWASDIPLSKVVIAEYDGFVSPFEASFFLCQLAPDNKIYINAPNGVDVMHVINKPDEKGLACDFQQHSIQLPTINAFSMPNFPYFRLGALEGSPCDTIGVSAVAEVGAGGSLEVSPNPASDWLTVRYDVPNSRDLLLVIYGANGMEVERVVLNETLGSQAVSIQNLANGLYFCKILENDKTLLVNRIAIMR